MGWRVSAEDVSSGSLSEGRSHEVQGSMDPPGLGACSALVLRVLHPRSLGRLSGRKWTHVGCSTETGVLGKDLVVL